MWTLIGFKWNLNMWARLQNTSSLYDIKVLLSYSNWASVQRLTSGSKNKGLHVSGKMVLNRTVLTHSLPIQRANCVCCCVVVHLGHDAWRVHPHAACWRAPFKLHPSKTLNQKASNQVTVHSFYFIFSFLYSGHHASCFMTHRQNDKTV